MNTNNSAGTDGSNCDQMRALISGLIDGELSADESREINEHLIRCSGCREDYEELLATGDRLGELTFREPGDDALSGMWRSPFHGLVRWGGMALVVGGYLVFLLYTAYQFLTNADEAPTMRAATAAIVLGLVILFAQVILERIRSWKTDPYKEIER